MTYKCSCQEQNTQRDETLRQLEIIKDIKGSKRAGPNIEETPKSKRRRKSPPGLSVCNNFDIVLDCKIYPHIHV